MIKERRRGRASGPLDAGPLAITIRVRRLVDDVHGGNLLEASAYSGVPYRTLREIHAGRGTPCPATLHRLAEAYDLPVDWFTSPRHSDDGTVPLAGWVGYLPLGESDSSLSGEAGRRRVTVPVGAWPLIRVLVQLEQRLTAEPPNPGRPIIGSATDPREIRGRVAAFILQPLLAARGPRAAEASRSTAERIDMLRDLGRFWERALSDLM